MPRTIEFILPIRLEKLSRIMRIRGADVYIHWSVFAVAGAILLGATQWTLALSLVQMACYLAVLFIHECGHLIAARRLRYKVHSIKLYPIFGLTEFDHPWNRFDHCVISWGGVLAQAVIAIPIVIYVELFGMTRFEPVNGALEILGFYSLVMAAINLLPAPPLDGAIAWGIFPEFFRRLKNRRSEQPSRQKYWR